MAICLEIKQRAWVKASRVLFGRTVTGYLVSWLPVNAAVYSRIISIPDFLLDEASKQADIEKPN